MTTQDHEAPVRPGNGGNGGPCTPSTTVNVTASADPSGSIQSDTTVQLSADGSVVTVHKDCTTHEQPVRTGTWSLSLSTPQGGTKDVSGLLSSRAGLGPAFVPHDEGIYTASFEAQVGLDAGFAEASVQFFSPDTPRTKFYMHALVVTGGDQSLYERHFDDGASGILGWEIRNSQLRLPVEGVPSLGLLGFSDAMSCAVAPDGTLFVVSLFGEPESLGFLVFTTRSPGGVWEPWRFIPSVSNPEIRPLANVCCTITPNGVVHIFAVGTGGQLSHTRRDNGTFQANWDGNFPSPDIRPIRQVACAADRRPDHVGDVYVMALTDNALFLTILSDDRPVPPWNADFPAPDIRPLVRPGAGASPIACATGPQNELHVLAVTERGELFHTIRLAEDGTGKFPADFARVVDATPMKITTPLRFVAATTDVAGNLNVCALPFQVDTQMWFARRNVVDGTWAGFVDVDQFLNVPGTIALSVAHHSISS